LIELVNLIILLLNPLNQIIIMTSQPNLSVLGFIPEQLVPVSVGHYQVNLYPKLSPSASVVERAHAFQICKSALSALNINIRILFDALGSQLNCMATINGLVYNYTQIYEEGWFNPANLQILSFHDSTGTQINNTTIACNPAILLPVVNGPVADCRQKDVRYVRVQLSLNFAGLLGPQHIGASVIKSMYYIELPQTLVNMTNGAGAAYVLTTYHGPADITSMTAEQILVDIINPCLQRGPISLSRANFNLQEANTDSTTIKDQLINKILVLGYASICASVFAISVPATPISRMRASIISARRLPALTARLSSQACMSSSNASSTRCVHLPRGRLSPSASATTSFAIWTAGSSHHSASSTQITQRLTIWTAQSNKRRSRRS
jgi:hypothetical protein